MPVEALYKHTRNLDRKLRVNINDYRAMIAKEAWTVWEMLPPQTRAWVGLDDLIQGGIIFARFRSLETFDPKKGYKFSTWLAWGLKNYYESAILDKLVKAQGRNEYGTMSIQGLQERFTQARTPDIDTVLAIANGRPLYCSGLASESALEACFASQALCKIYDESSPVLQKEIETWFLLPESRTHVNGEKFDRVVGEFRELATEYGLDIGGARHLVKSPSCMDHVSRHINWVPYGAYVAVKKPRA